MFCPNCGEEIQDGFEFCIKCGKKISEVNSTDSIKTENVEVAKKVYKKKLISIVAVIVVVACLIVALFIGKNNKYDLMAGVKMGDSSADVGKAVKAKYKVKIDKYNDDDGNANIVCYPDLSKIFDLDFSSDDSENACLATYEFDEDDKLNSATFLISCDENSNSDIKAFKKGASKLEDYYSKRCEKSYGDSTMKEMTSGNEKITIIWATDTMLDIMFEPL